MNRRELLKISGTAVAGLAGAESVPLFAAQRKRTGKRVIVIGAGITGLCCAYELVKRGNDVTVIEASHRVGGHVRTLSDPFADGLYAEVGAEHFNYPEYVQYWRYVKEFKLTAIPHPVKQNRVRFLNGERFTDEDLRRNAVLDKLGFNQRESEFLADHAWLELPHLYLQQYVENIRDEADPFRGGLSKLDQLSVADLLKRDNASAAALQFFGGSNSALQAVWGAAMKKLRGADFDNKKLFRLKGGNERMTDAFRERLSDRIHLGCPVTSIDHGSSGATITYRQNGEVRRLEAEYLVSAISLVGLRQIPVSPAWPEAKAFLIQEMPYTIKARVVFQSKTRFWRTDGISTNWQLSDPMLNNLWSIADEVNTPRGILVANTQTGVTASASLATFLKHYPKGTPDIERTIVHDWAKDPWAGMCERGSYRPGQLARFWPEVTRPCGRIHFAGAYAAPMSWGQEAALESANRAAEEIDRA